MNLLDGYLDGIAPLAPERVDVMRCPTCHEARPDLSMPCERCGEVE